MIAPGVYLIALLLYFGLGLAFSAGCLVVAVIPRLRSVSLRAALSMVATFPGVVLYQLISLPFLAVLFVVGVVLTTLLGYYKDPTAWGIFALVLSGAFLVASAVGFVSAWRVAWCALSERSFSAGWRREFLVAAWNCLWDWRRRRLEACREPMGKSRLLGE